MHSDPTLLRWDSPSQNEDREPQNTGIGSQQAWRLKAEGRHNLGNSNQLEGRCTGAGQHPSSTSNPCSRRPLAQAGERSPPEPVARSLDSVKMFNSAPSTVQTHTTHTPPESVVSPLKEVPTSPADPRKLVASIPEALLANLRSKCTAKASVSLLGRIQGKHPGLRALTAWARESLHPSLALLSLKSNNVFEVTFEQPEGRIHALNQADLTCESAAIFFSSWRPHFDAKTPHAEDSLDHPVWVQIVDLCQVLREESFLHIIGEHIGQVISIDNSEAYKAKLFGPRIRLLVRDLNNLPHTVVIPRLDNEGTVEYALEFSGLPNQCGRCRSREHQVRNCPKKDFQRRRDLRPFSTHNKPDNHHISPSITPSHKTTEETQDIDKSLPSATEGEGDVPRNWQPIVPASPAQEAPFNLLPEPDPDCARTPDYTVASGTPVTPDASGTSNPILQTDDQNFPKLPSAKSRGTGKEIHPEHNQGESLGTPHFVWRSKPITGESHNQQTPTGEEEKGGGKSIGTAQKIPDSAPITRQGYRTGRLAEDFWTTMNFPNTPTSSRKTLQVIPFLLKDNPKETVEYLVDNKTLSFKPIAQVHIAELLAGIPWTEPRARQHVVNEVAQALHKTFVFTNKSPNPLQKWKQGRWFANWEEAAEGEYTCFLYVSIKVHETKIKPRRGQSLGWRRVPSQLWERISSHTSDTIADSTEDSYQWQQMIAKSPHNGTKTPVQPTGITPHNRFSALVEEDLLNPDTLDDW